eukprot:scaffold195850_cov18-Tisochrysis_lutea.AAC.1
MRKPLSTWAIRPPKGAACASKTALDLLTFDSKGMQSKGSLQCNTVNQLPQLPAGSTPWSA